MVRPVIWHSHSSGVGRQRFGSSLLILILIAARSLRPLGSRPSQLAYASPVAHEDAPSTQQSRPPDPVSIPLGAEAAAASPVILSAINGQPPPPGENPSSLSASTAAQSQSPEKVEMQVVSPADLDATVCTPFRQSKTGEAVASSEPVSRHDFTVDPNLRPPHEKKEDIIPGAASVVIPGAAAVDSGGPPRGEEHHHHYHHVHQAEPRGERAGAKGYEYNEEYKEKEGDRDHHHHGNDDDEYDDIDEEIFEEEEEGTHDDEHDDTDEEILVEEEEGTHHHYDPDLEHELRSLDQRMVKVEREDAYILGRLRNVQGSPRGCSRCGQ